MNVRVPGQLSGSGFITGCWKPLAVGYKEVDPDSQLLELRQALHLRRLGFRVGQGRKQQGSENGDDRNHDQKFDQRKSRNAAGFAAVTSAKSFHFHYRLFSRTTLICLVTTYFFPAGAGGTCNPAL